MAAQTIECTTACTVTLQLEAAPVDTEDLGDVAQAFGLMFLVLVALWGGRELKKLFSAGPHDGG